MAALQTFQVMLHTRQFILQLATQLHVDLGRSVEKVSDSGNLAPRFFRESELLQETVRMNGC